MVFRPFGFIFCVLYLFFLYICFAFSTAFSGSLIFLCPFLCSLNSEVFYNGFVLLLMFLNGYDFLLPLSMLGSFSVISSFAHGLILFVFGTPSQYGSHIVPMGQ